MKTMKKVLFLFAVLTTMVFTSCEKEDGPQVLSEFIVGGEWVYEQTIEEFEELQTITFLGQFFADGTYKLTLTDGTQYIPFTGNYSINDDTNVLTIDEPENMGAGGVSVFDVAWTEGVEQMVWTDTEYENAMTWTR